MNSGVEPGINRKKVAIVDNLPQMLRIVALGNASDGGQAIRVNNYDGAKVMNSYPYTRYSIVTEGSESYLRTESNASASGLVLEKEFNVYEYPKMRWRWKVENVYHKGDAHTKSGDDYPMRILIIFKYGRDEPGMVEYFGHSIFRQISEEHPPHSGLNYAWANKEHPEYIITSPYTDRIKMILIEKGTVNTGRWIEEEVDILKDYEQAFNQEPPKFAELAIMNDSDNTGESSVSGIDWIKISK
jgi:hypothetical protein